MTRPLPHPTPLTEGFWAAARKHRLVVQRCADCGRFRHYPQPRCPDCVGDDWSWTEVSGRGAVYTWTRSHKAFHPAFADRVPYVVATVELAEGVRMMSDLPPEDTDHVRIGADVEVFFDDLPGTDFTLPRFRLVRP